MANFTQIYISPASDDESVYVETPGSIWKPGSRIAEREDFEPVLPGFVRRMAKIYRDKVKKAILTQEYADKEDWPDLNPEYKEWKQRYGLDTRMWIRSGQLIEAIKTYKFTFKDVWVVGIHHRKRFRKVETRQTEVGGTWSLGARTDTHILTVAKVLEHGAGTPGGENHVPARPLFRPVQRDISKNISDYWNEYVHDLGFSKNWKERTELTEEEVEERAF